MKKILISLFLIITLCGCNKKNEVPIDVEHYNLNEHMTSSSYTIYTDDSRIKHTYMIYDITPKNSEEIINGLFYKVGENDFILLDKIKSCNSPTEYNSKTQNYFYQNRLYVNRCSGGVVLEYILDGEKITKTELTLKYDTSSISESIALRSINKVNASDVYYNAYDYITHNDKVIKCSTINYKCESSEE